MAAGGRGARREGTLYWPVVVQEALVEYLIFAVLMAASLTAWRSFRARSAGDTSKSVESFRRAMKALRPESTNAARGRRKRR